MEKWSFLLFGKGKIVKVCKEFVKVYKLITKTFFKWKILILGFFLFNFANMAKNIFARSLILIYTILIGYNSVHPIVRKLWIILYLLRFHCWSNNISYMRSLLRQISSEIHFFPSISFSSCYSWKSKIRANTFTFYKVHSSVYL